MLNFFTFLFLYQNEPKPCELLESPPSPPDESLGGPRGPPDGGPLCPCWFIGSA